MRAEPANSWCARRVTAAPRRYFPRSRRLAAETATRHARGTHATTRCAALVRAGAHAAAAQVCGLCAARPHVGERQPGGLPVARAAQLFVRSVMGVLFPALSQSDACHVRSMRAVSSPHLRSRSLNCSGVHRSLGVHITQVRSIGMDAWFPEQIEARRASVSPRDDVPPLRACVAERRRQRRRRATRAVRVGFGIARARLALSRAHGRCSRRSSELSYRPGAQTMKQWGNARARAFWEANVPEDYSVPVSVPACSSHVDHAVKISLVARCCELTLPPQIG